MLVMFVRFAASSPDMHFGPLLFLATLFLVMAGLLALTECLSRLLFKNDKGFLAFTAGERKDRRVIISLLLCVSIILIVLMALGVTDPFAVWF